MKKLVCLLAIVALFTSSAFAANVYIEGPDNRTTPVNEDGIQPPGTGVFAVRVLVEDIPSFSGIQFALQFKDKATGQISNAFTILTNDRPWDPDNGKPGLEGVGYSWHADGRYEWGAIPDDPDTEDEDESQPGLAVRHNSIKFGAGAFPVYVPTEDPMTTFGFMCSGDLPVTAKVWALKLYYEYDVSAPASFDIVFNMGTTLVSANSVDITGTCTITNGSVTIAPEPASMALLGAGLLGLIGYGRKRIRK